MEAQEKNNFDASKEEQRNILLNNEKCDQCGMLFTSTDSLRIHKEKFCIGVMDSGVNRIDSPPINSKYIENLKRQNQFNNEEIDDLNLEMDNMPKNIQNDSLNDINREFEELGQPTSNNFKNDEDKQSFSDEKRHSQIRLKNSYSINETLSQEGLNQSTQKTNELSKNYNQSIQNGNDSKLRNKNKTNEQINKELVSINNQIKDSLTQRSDQVSIFSNTRYIGTPNGKINFVDPNSKLTNDETLSIGKTESVIDEVKKFKNKKSVEQSLQDLEDTLIRDTIRDKKLVDSLSKNSAIQSNEFVQNLDNYIQDPYKKLLQDVYLFYYDCFLLSFFI